MMHHLMVKLHDAPPYGEAACCTITDALLWTWNEEFMRKE
jgi:hypothetical protein